MKICIDPGHGGNDSGALGPTGLMEKNINLSIAISVDQILKKHGVDVILTRRDDRRVELANRVKVANDSKADYFVSIHMNSASDPTATGTETFAFPNSIPGTKLADSIQKALVDEIKLENRGVKFENFFVLRNTKMPAVLVEAAFINNPKEEKLLKNQNFLSKIAMGISKGVLAFTGIKYRGSIDTGNDISPWATEAMKWATSKKINLTDGSMPKQAVSLERLMTILHRYHNL